MPIISPNTNGNQTFFSVVNSSTAPLPANGEFLGDWEDASTFTTISTICKTDQPGTLYYDFSIDGNIVDKTFSIPQYDFEDGQSVTAGPCARYLRIRYVNGQNAQTIFRLQTAYNPLLIEGYHTPLMLGLTSNSTTSASRSLMFGLAPDQTYQPVKVAADGTLLLNTNVQASLSPVLKTKQLMTEESSADQVVLSYTPSSPLSVYGFSVYVWDTMASSQVVFGEASLESPPGTKLYTAQLTSMGGGKEYVGFSQPISFRAGQEIVITCSPSAPVTNQVWRANLVGAA